MALCAYGHGDGGYGRLARLMRAAAFFVVALLAPQIAVSQETASNPDGLRLVAEIVARWDGQDAGALFRAVKAVNPSKGAIVSMRELNKAMGDGSLKLGAVEQASIGAKFKLAQSKVKEKIVSVRRDAHLAYAQANPEQARTLSSDGDVGSWRTSDDINSDVDWTAFGADRNATKDFVDNYYNRMLIAALAGEGAGLDLKQDFDIVVTPEGWEKEAGVFETSGGKSLAKTVMTVVTPVNADGTLGTAKRNDIAAELENTKTQARLRELATKLGVYKLVFNEKGNFVRYGDYMQPPQDPAQRQAWETFMEAADDEGLLVFDGKIVKRETLAGACLDMAKHLHHEAIEQLGTLDKKGQVKRIMKYPGRSEWAYGKSAVSPELIESYVVMGDDRIRRLLEQSRVFHAAKESKAADAKEKFAQIIDNMSAEYSDSGDLGRLSLEMIVRQTHLAMQLELDRIAKMESATERSRRLQALINDFAVMEGDPALGAFAGAQRRALSKFKAMSDSPDRFAQLKKSYVSIDEIDAATGEKKSRMRSFLSQSELGKKILESSDEAMEIAEKIRKMKEEKIDLRIAEFQIQVVAVYEQLKEGSELLQFVEVLQERYGDFQGTVGAPTKTFESVLNSFGTLVDVLSTVSTSKTDAELSYNLGKLFWDNTTIGGMVNSLYGFVVQGDNEALAKFVMFALCPQASIPELVNKIGSFAMRTGAQRLFDAQLEALYQASYFAGDPDYIDKPQWKDKEPWLLANFAEYGAGSTAVSAFLDDLLLPGGYAAAQDMISKLKGRPSDNQLGNEVIAKAAVAKAIWMTLALGDHVVLKDDAALAEAAQRVKLLTDEIIYLAKRLGKEVARAPENFNMPDGASPGEQAAINKLVKERDVWVGKAKLAMAEAIARTFEERRRAESDLSDDATKRRLEELRALLTKLDVLEPGLYNLGEEGSYNFLLRNVPFVISSKQQKRKLVEAINRYFDAYSQVLSLRDALAQLHTVHAGRQLDKLPLTSAPPLCGERSIDLQNSLTYFQKVRDDIAETSRSLAGIKGAPLAGPFDDRIRRGVNEANMAMAQADATGAIARACRELHWRVEVVDRARFTEAATEATSKFEAARLKRDELMQEFTRYYAAIKALSLRITINPGAPIQSQPVSAQVVVERGAAPEGAGWVWELHDQGSPIKTMRGAAVTFEAPFKGRYTLKAALVLSGVTVKTASLDFAVVGGSGLRVVLSPVDPDPAAPIAAEASWSSAPAGADVAYEWGCDTCAPIGQQGARASFRAPQSGRGQVTLRARLGATILGEAVAAFSVKDPKKPTTQETRQPDRTNPPPTPPVSPPISSLSSGTPPGPSSDAKPPNQKTDGTTGVSGKDKPAIPASALAELPLGTWSQAQTARDRYRETLQRGDLSPQDRAKATDLLGAAEKRLRELWDEAKNDVAGLPAFLNKYLGELDRIYAGFKAKAPKKPDRPDEGGNVTDLDGETPWSRYQCVVRMDKELEERRAEGKALVTKATALESQFTMNFDGGSGNTAAMRAFDAFWPGQMLVGRKWRTSGLERSISNPCSDTNESAKLKLDPVGPAGPATVSTDTKQAAPPLKASLSIDPASRGKPDATVIAKVEGGMAPFRYSWMGARSNTGDRAVYAVPASRGSNVQAVVQVTDAAGKVASASIPIEPLLVKVELARTQPASGDVPVGGQISFDVRLSSDGKPVDASAYVLRWEPSTEARFSSPEGAGVTKNSATWSRPGKAKVWVVALHREGAALATVGESNQIDLSIVGSSIALRAEPAQPLVGQEVRITATETPAAPDSEAQYWWEISGQAASAGQTQNPRVYSYIAKDTQPVAVTARLKERRHGDEVARQTLSVTARAYSVSIANLGAAFDNSTTRPVIWRPGQGLVTLGKEIAAHQDVALRADVTPSPVTTQIRYRWTVGEGASVSGNPASRETRVQRASKGSIQATVEVRDANDIVLGKAVTSVSVTVSDEDIATGKQKSAELARLKEAATSAWSNGDLDAACQKAVAAQQIDPKFPLAATYCSGRDRVNALVHDIEATLKPGATKAELDGAQSKLDQASAINPKAKPLADLKKRLDAARGGSVDVSKALADATQAWNSGDAAGAARIAGDAAKASPTNVEAQLQKKRYDEGLAALEASVRTAKDALNRKDLNAAAAAVAAGQKTLANYKPLQEINQLIASQREADQRARAERQSHLDLLQAGSQSCDQKRWKDCKDKIEAGLADPRVFLPADAPVLDKAKGLLSRAASELDAAQKAAANANKQNVPSVDPKKQAEADQQAREQKCRAIATEGIKKQSAKDHAGAIPLYKQAIDLCPKLCPVMNNLGVAYENVGNTAAAKPWFEAALKCEPTNELYKKNVAVNQANLKPPPPLPPPPPSVNSLDGVYEGWADRDGKHTSRYVATVTGSRIVMIAQNDSKKEPRVGVIRPNGEFVIQFASMTYNGRIVGTQVTGTWTLRLSLFGGPPTIYTGGFTGSKVK